MEEVIDNEFILFDRLEVIKNTIQKYGEENFYLSFSGGKDSTVLHHLIDLALPDNRIPRVYANTGIEYQAIVNHVKELQKNDDRIVIINPSVNIKKTLEQKGYPFKSKEHSKWVWLYRRNKQKIDNEIKKIKKDPSLLFNYDHIHNLPRGTKAIVKYYFGIRERERECYTNSLHCPNKLLYQFEDGFEMNISDNCCLEFKEKPAQKWAKENGKKHMILGLMEDEGGRRALRGKCIYEHMGKVSFSPLMKVSKEWEDWFIEKQGIKLCELYYPPYNFTRTGCRGCPFNINLEEELNKMPPVEKAAAEVCWKPVYDEYRRIGYRLKSEEQMEIWN